MKVSNMKLRIWIRTDGLLDPTIPMDLSGGNFSHVFGTNTSAFERFVLERKVMGPCWLNVTNATLSTKDVSYCQHFFDYF